MPSSDVLIVLKIRRQVVEGVERGGDGSLHVHVFAIVYVCVCACVRAYVCACVCACMDVCVRVWVGR